MENKESADSSKSAKDIINNISAIIRTAQIHDPGNIAVTSAIERLLAIINPLVDEKHPLTLELIGEFFYLDKSRVRYSMEYLINFEFLIHEFKKRELGSIAFNGLVSPGDFQVFVRNFLSSAFSEDPFGVLSKSIAGSPSIVVGPLREVRDDGEKFDIKKQVRTTYFNAVSFTKGIMNQMKAGEKITFKKTKRIVESMVDLILDNAELLVGMTTIKDYDEYTYHHSVNVSVLSVALGQKLGFSKSALTELGVVALFHDTGKLEVPAEILNKPTNFNEAEWNIMRKHPAWGVRAILKLKETDKVSIRSAIVAFEHHINIDMSGYPKVPKDFRLDLYSKIVSIADQYDAMTSARVYIRTPMAPDKALSVMIERMGTQLDPLLLKFFINMVGIFPIGTLVMLDSRELGIVYENNSTFPDRPRILIIIDSRGAKVKSYIADLSEKDNGGKFTRTITKTLDPNKYKINLAEYLL